MAVTAGGLTLVPTTAQAAGCASGTWTEQFFANATLSGRVKKTTCDTSINENWGTGHPNVSGLGKDDFSIRWTQTRDFGGGGPFTISTASQDGVRVYVDGKKVLDAWKDVSTTQKRSVLHTFAKGKHGLRVDYFAGRGSANVSVSLTPASRDKVAPNAPTGVKAGYTYPTAKLTWTKSPEADLAGYRVYRSTSSSVPVTSGNLVSGSRLLTTTSFSNNPPATGARYYYRVVAVDKSQNASAGSSVVSVLSKDVTGPSSAPKNVTVASDGAGNNVSWTKPTTDTVKYRVYRAASVTGTGAVKLADTTATSYKDTSAAERTTYFYAVSALDAAGNESARSAYVAGTRPDTTAPAAPGTVTATGVTGAVDLSWPANTDDTTAYEVWSAGSADGTYTKLATVTSPSYEDIAATVGSVTYYKVYAVDAAGNISGAATATGTALAAPDTTAPDAPTGLSGTGGDREVDLSWTASASTDTTSYRVYRSTSPDVAPGADTLIASGVDGTSYTDATGLADGTTYYYVVTAVDAAGNESVAGDGAGAKTRYFAADAVVSPTAGKGDHTTLQAAIDAAPSGATSDYTILVKPGTYTGVVTVPAGKTHLVITGGTDDASDTVVTESHGVTDTDSTYTTETSATFFADSDGLTVKNLTIANGYTEVAANKNNQAVALRTTGDRQIYDNVRLLGNQDTVYLRTPDKRVLIRNSYLEGDTDWLFGAGVAVFQNDEIHYTYSRAKNGGSITAASTQATSAHGFLVTGSRITVANGVTSYYLGRPWPQFSANSGPQVIVRDTDIPVTPTSPWKNWNDTYTWQAARYSEYHNTGAGADNSGTNANRPQLTDTQAKQDTAARFLMGGDAWDPTGTLSQEDLTAPDAATGLAATVDGTGIELSWTASASADIADYKVYRSSGGGTATLLDTVTGTSYRDTAPTQGTAYTYYVVAEDTSGNPSDASGTATATVPVPLVDEPPAAPTGLTARGAAGQIDLSWTAPGDSDLAGYRIYRSTSAGVTATAANLLASGVTATSYSDTSADFGTTYHYAVVAVDDAGHASDPSGEAGAAELPAGADVVVAADGSGDYTTVSAAVAATSGGTSANPYVIAIKPGTYRETVLLKNKPYTQLIGTSSDASDTTIVYNKAAGSTNPSTGGTYGTSGSATFTNQSKNTLFKNLTISNDFDEAANATLVNNFVGQAVALLAQGDRQVYDNVRLLGNQDTLYTKYTSAPGDARQYFTHSYIAGDVDFISGNGLTVFDDTTFKVLTYRTGTPILSAPQTPSGQTYGFLIANSAITTDGANATASITLGRPWSATAQQVIRNTSLPSGVGSAPYRDWSTTQTWQAASFAEYQNTGAGADNSGTNTDRPQLTGANEGTYTVAAYLAGSDGWAPQS